MRLDHNRSRVLESLLFERVVATQDAVGEFGVEFILPARDDDRCHAISDEIGNGADLAHEAVHAKQQRDAGYGDGSQRRKRCRDVIKPPPVTAAAPLEFSISTSSTKAVCPTERWVLVACAMNSAAMVR